MDHLKSKIPLMLAVAMLSLSGCSALTQPRIPVTILPAGTVTDAAILQDPRWNDHRKYANQLIQRIQKEWYHILAESRSAPPRGSHVRVTFKIDPNGDTEITAVEDSNAGKQGVFSCINAITHPQPFPKWTEKMKTDLGAEQQITVDFYYQ